MDIERRINGTALAKLLGPWRSVKDRNLAGCLAQQTRLLVLDGRLPVRTKLPSERELAKALGLSRTTVAAAYSELRSAGFLESRQGAGTWVTMELSSSKLRVTPWLPGGSSAHLDLTQAALAAPHEFCAEAVRGAMELFPKYSSGHGYHLLGLLELRLAVAQRLTQRGLPTTVDEVLITTGAQQALALALRSFLTRGSRALVEHPTYPNALDTIHSLGARAVPIGFDGSVWDLELMRETARNSAPDVIYLVPDFHNPTGLCMSEAERDETMNIAQRTATPLIVDETLTDLVLEGPSHQPLASFSPSGNAPVVTVGSLSKIFWGGLRIGWLRGPAKIVRKAAGIKATADMSTPVIEQLMAVQILSNIEQILDWRRTELLVARDHLVTQLHEELPEIDFTVSSGGLSLWLNLGQPVSSRLAAAASNFGVMVTPGPRFGINGAFERFLRIPYTLPVAQTTEAISRLARAWDTMGRGTEMSGQAAA